MITWRVALYFYNLLLPFIALQWLLNDGCSMVNNFENLLRKGEWHDQEKSSPDHDGTLFVDAQLLGLRHMPDDADRHRVDTVTGLKPRRAVPI
jgi:hypothetical protein